MDVNTVASGTSQVRTLEDLQRSSAGNALGRDDFLQILVAQLSNQNPMEPTSDTEFIAQLAQFSMLEQMQSMNTGFATSQAYSLIGKTVYVEGGENAEPAFGRVDGVVKKDGIDYLLIGEDIYEVSSVTGVLDDSTIQGITDQNILYSANLIGRTVTASYENDGETISVSGQVEKITIQDDAILAVVDGVSIPLSSISEIAA